MALRRITIDIEDAGVDKKDRNLYGLSITTSEDGTKLYEDVTVGKLATLVEFRVREILETLPSWSASAQAVQR